jgi:hypothetical protein
MRIVQRIVDCNILFSVLRRNLNVRRDRIAQEDKATVSLYFVYSGIESVAEVNSVENGAEDSSIIIVDKSELEIMVPSGSNDYIFSIKMRIKGCLDEFNCKKNSIRGKV